MRLATFFIVVVSCSLALAQKADLTVKDVETVRKGLRGILQGSRTAHALRISFHDCVGGACDGCFNRDNPRNAGPMLSTLAVMDKLYEDNAYAKLISRADFYALAGLVAVEEAVKFNNKGCSKFCMPEPNFTFKYGRRDCPTSPKEPRNIDFPSGELTYLGVVDFYKKEFGMDERESVAIMGAHTLGGANGRAATGFRGFFKEGPVEAQKFNNEYYAMMIDRSIEYRNVDKSKETGVSRPRFQWDGFRKGQPTNFMLNSDICLFKNIQTNPNGESRCKLSDCPVSLTANVVEEYAKDGSKFMRDFVPAMEKMVAKGQKNLKLPKGSCPGRIGPDLVIFDESCLNPSRDPFGGVGCNAGGQGQACRFCGAPPRKPCPP